MGVAELERAIEEPTTGVAALERDLAKPPLSTAQKVVRGAAGSTVGGALGGAAGAIVGSVVPGIGTAAGAIGGTMVGSAAGEAVTQFLDPLGSGVQEPSLMQIALAGAIPAVPAVVRRFFVSLPGAAAGLQEFLLKRLGDRGERLLAMFAPVPGTADDLFKQARAAGASVNVATSSTQQAAADIAKEVAKSKFATGGSKLLAEKAQEFLGLLARKAGMHGRAAAPGLRASVPFDEFRLNQSDVGALVRSLDRKGGAALGRAKQLYAAMWDDLEASLGSRVEVTTRPRLALPPAGGTTTTGPPRTFGGRAPTARESVERTLEAAEAFRTGTPYREGASSIIDVVPGAGQLAGQRLGPAAAQIVGPTAQATTTRVVAPGPTQDLLRRAIDTFKREEASRFFKDYFNVSVVRRVGQRNLDVDAMMTKIDRNRDILGRLMPAAEIDDVLATLRGFAKIPTIAKTPQLGFEQIPIGQRLVVGGAIGLVGGAVGGAGAAGMVAGGAAGILAVEAISTALSTAPGRFLVRQVMERGATLDQVGNALLQGGRSYFTPADAVRIDNPEAVRELTRK